MLTLTDPATIRALNWLASYAKKYGADKLQVVAASPLAPSRPTTPSSPARSAMMVAGSWHTEALRTYNPKLDYIGAPDPLPARRPPECHRVLGQIYMVPQGSKHPLEAVKFAMWAGNGVAVIGNENVWHTFPGYKQGPTRPKNIWQQHGDAGLQGDREALGLAKRHERRRCCRSRPSWTNEMWAAEQNGLSIGQGHGGAGMTEVQNRLQPILDKALHQ